MKLNSFLLRISILSSVLFLVSACLKTRGEVKETEQRQVIQQQVTTMQKANADSNNRFSEIEEKVREMNGRVEVLESKSQAGDQDTAKDIKTLAEQQAEISRKLNLLQESMIKMEAQMQQNVADASARKAEKGAEEARAAANQAKKSIYQVAEDQFAQKEWKKAILSYEEYREKNPSGKKFADATYKIGVCFQELKMKDEARTFYEEVSAKFPNSEEARRAKLRLKSLKK